MDVFIMWAGERSHTVARHLKEFLEFVVRGPKYFISDDIEGGRLWRVALAGKLQDSSFGIACLTADNLRSHWLHFEAGALSKAVGQAHVVPLLIGPKTTDVEGPLSDFQMLRADEAGLRKLTTMLAAQVPDTSLEVVEKSFRFVWPDFLKKLEHAESITPNVEDTPVRSEAAMIQEILDRVRRLETRSDVPPVQGKSTERPSVGSVDEHMLQTMRNEIVTLIDSVAPETTQTKMDEEIEEWRALLKKKLTAEQLLEIYRQARNLESYLNR